MCSVCTRERFRHGSCRICVSSVFVCPACVMGDPPHGDPHSSSSPTNTGTASSLSVPAVAHATSAIGSTFDTRWGNTTFNVDTTRLAAGQVARDHSTRQRTGQTDRSQRETTRAGAADGAELFDEFAFEPLFDSSSASNQPPHGSDSVIAAGQRQTAHCNTV